MALRLGFAIAAHLDSEIFLIDEVLAVGDQYFQRKCVKKIEDFLSQGRTIVLVSHDLHAIRSLCDEVLWLDGGEVRAVGPAREVVERYLDLDRARSGGLRPTPRTDPSPLHHALELPPLPSSQPRFRMSVDDPELKRAVLSACAMPEPERLWAQPVESSPYETYDGDQAVLIGSGEVRVLSVRILDARGAPRLRFRTGEPMVVAVTFRTTSPVERPVMGVALHRNDGVYVYGPNTRFDGVLDGTYHGIYTYFLHYPRLPLLSGRYEVSVAVFDKHHLKPHVWHNRLYELEVAQEVEDHGLVYVDHAWGLITHLEAEGAVTEPGEP